MPLIILLMLNSVLAYAGIRVNKFLFIIVTEWKINDKNKRIIYLLGGCPCLL